MDIIITDEKEKREYNLLFKYIQSVGVKSAKITFDEFENDLRYVDLDFLFEDQLQISNKRSAYLPLFANNLLKKIVSERIDGDSYLIDNDDITSSYLMITIDSVEKSIKGVFGYYYPVSEDGSSYDWDKDDKEGSKIIKILKSSEVTPDNSGMLVLDYSGGGDSGYLESTFNNRGGRVPQVVEDWCYKMLEELHGGWEINEGSQGYFEFDLNRGTILLEHTYNEERLDTEEIFSVTLG